MKGRWLLGAGVLALLVVSFLFLWKRSDAATTEPERLANEIASGKTITLGDGAKMIGHSPAADYFALPAGEQRTAYLDKMIDQQEEMRKDLESGKIKLPEGAPSFKTSANGAETEGKGQTSVKHETSADGKEQKVTIRLNADDLSPAFRAQMQEFHAALRNRRKERGLDPDAPFMIMRKEIHAAK